MEEKSKSAAFLPHKVIGALPPGQFTKIWKNPLRVAADRQELLCDTESSLGYPTWEYTYDPRLQNSSGDAHSAGKKRYIAIEHKKKHAQRDRNATFGSGLQRPRAAA